MPAVRVPALSRNGREYRLQIGESGEFMARKIARVRGAARTANGSVRRNDTHASAPVVVDHRKGVLFSSASAVALAALLAIGVMSNPAHAEPLAPEGCTESSAGSGNWFCNNGSGGEQGGNIDGNANDNTIEIIGGSYTLGDYPSTNVNGGDGADIITIKTTPGTGESSIAIDGSISGDGGKDTITIGGGSFTDPTWTGWTNINGDVDGGDDDDIINITASDQMLTGINKVDGKGGNVLGGSGDDEINITNSSDQNISIGGSVEGGSGEDKITVAASNGAEISIGDDIEGGDGEDRISLSATRGGRSVSTTSTAVTKTTGSTCRLRAVAKFASTISTAAAVMIVSA